MGACVCVMLFALQANAQAYSRIETITYHDNTTKWVVGQTASVICTVSVPASTACNGDVVYQTTYDTTYALPTQIKAFGKIQQTLAYDTASSVVSGQRGTLKTSKDGSNNVTTYTNWKRGVPQLITYPATTDQPVPATQRAVVNDAGWITSVNDENNSKTCYGYDAMGRINKITYPSETANVCDESKWASTTITFKAGNPESYGMPAGHWRQTTQTGRGRKIIIYDALWRPVVEQTLDLDRVSTTTSEIIRRYDAAGRLAFQSYPMNTVGTAVYTDTSLKGAHTTYDALDRVTKVEQDSELGKLTTTNEYLSGAQGPYIRTKNPRGYYTWQSLFMAYDEPSYDLPGKIQQHSSGGVGYALTNITRDAMGKPTAIVRHAGDNSVTETRTYAYNNSQELCRQVEPETGATVLGYDGAGNLTWSASGVESTIGCSADGVHSKIAPRRIDRSYDARNRLVSVVYPNHLGDTSHVYTPDGRLASITADNGGSNQVRTEYAYNRRGLMSQERLKWGTINWPVDYVYNANGHISAQKWHGLNITYVPNAIGQPTQAGTYASSVTYHPNGAIKSFTYGNNIKHTSLQNDRGLPDRSQDVYGSTKFLDDGYDYDQNGNVAAISDGTAGSAGNRTMTYDALDRLTKTVAPGMFGTATYTYDALDNITRTKVTAGNKIRDHYYCYDASWRLTNIKTGGCSGATVMGIGYDVQGNVSNRNGHTFAFDFGNRLRTVSSPTTNYVYDGLGRRVRDITVESKYSQYTNAGELVMEGDRRKGTVTEYIHLQGSLVAQRERDTATNVYTVKYQHTDALGSPVAITSQSRGVLEKRKIEPFGNQISPAPTDGPAFTGHLYDAATGMVYMQQRYYDPAIGRFLSVDPVTADGNNGGNFNRYWYANNNPYKFTDPDGRFVLQAGGIIGGAIVGVLVTAGGDLIRGEISSGGTYAGAAAGGAVAGAILTTTGNPVLAGAAGGATSSALQQKIDTGQVNGADVATGAVVGGVVGGVVPGARIPGITAGRNSFAAVAKTAQTKLANGTISRVSAKTVAKASVAAGAEGAAGAAVGDAGTRGVNSAAGAVRSAIDQGVSLPKAPSLPNCIAKACSGN